MLTLKLPQWVWILIFVGLGIVLFSLIRGCRNENKAISNNSNLIAENKRLQKIHIDDSLSGLKSKQAFNDTIEFVNGQLDLTENQVIASKSDLHLVEKKINALLARYVAIPPDTDTSVTLVPNEYIENCADCFGELENGKELVKKANAERDNLDQLYRSKINVQDTRIKGLEIEKGGLNKQYNTLKTRNDSLTSAVNPGGKLYLSWGVMWGPLPRMAGAGLLYQNKRNVLWGAKWYYGAQGHMVETTINFPLSLKLK